MKTPETESREFFQVPLPKKSLVLLESGVVPSLSVLEALKDEWAIVPVRSLESLKKYSRKEKVDVGLAYLPADMTEKKYRDLLSLSEVTCRWIALLEPRGLGNFHVLRLIQNVCHDFHLLPVDPDRLKVVMGHALGMARIPLLSDQAVPEESVPLSDLVGRSPAMQEVVRRIRKVASVDASVLITGESGTGKELVARAIHEQSGRRRGPFIAINCGAIPYNLIQSELFGYEKGAFTGAASRKIGHIESAHTGTIMLDEIGDMPLELQVNLLRVLETGKILRVGSSLEIPVDVRIIAATHKDLEKACREGRFREDLFYRLNVLKIPLPPLRSREGDIIALAQHFFRKFSTERVGNLKGFTPAALREMLRYPWPGNVRELINKVQSAVLMSDGPFIRPEDLGLDAEEGSSRSHGETLREIKNRVEREIILATLHRNNNNVNLSSRHLGVTRTTLYALLKKYGLGADGRVSAEGEETDVR
ncbi:MAG: sigma-54 dependent transcriptional regulator [Nitrospirae bacterium]|nr:sigma-54 dependent transcriptional regulator [Nitrospirota bacterium]MCL5284503.1 sigma-54 dependent transcriptional regulator [Nitrospirota bacterium]